MQTFMECEQKKLLKKFHTLLGKFEDGVERKAGILWRLGVESAKELSIEQLVDECDALVKCLNPNLAELEKARERVIAAVSYYHEVMGDVELFEKRYAACSYAEKARRRRYAMGTAEHAAGKIEFNRIPLEQLRSLYGKFTKGAKVVMNADNIMRGDYLRSVISWN